MVAAAQVRPYALAERARVRASHVVCPRPAEECAAAAAGQIRRVVVHGTDAVQMGPEVR